MRWPGSWSPSPAAALPEAATIGGIVRGEKLLIAHHEHCARHVAGTLPRRKLRRQQFDHAPLPRTGILRLVHQNMVNSAVQPVQNPGRHRWVGQQGRRAKDQVIKIQLPPRGLARLVDREEGFGETMQRQTLLRR